MKKWILILIGLLVLLIPLQVMSRDYLPRSGYLRKVPTPTEDEHIANKKYVDDNAGGSSGTGGGVSVYSADDTVGISGASNIFIVPVHVNSGASSTVVTDGSGGATVYVGYTVISSGNKNRVAIISSGEENVQGTDQIQVLSGPTVEVLGPSGNSVFTAGVDDGGISGASIEMLFVYMPATRSAPSNPRTGEIRRFDPTVYDPAGIGGTTPYIGKYSGGKWVAIQNDDADTIIGSNPVTVLTSSDLNDDSTPHILSDSDVMDKIIVNRSGTTAGYEFPAPTGNTGYNVQFICETDNMGTYGGVSISPASDGGYIYLNGTLLPKGKGIVNAAPSDGERVVCDSTGASIYCESKYGDFKEDPTPGDGR